MGIRFGGRAKGTKNKKTLEREAAITIDAAKDGVERELGKDVLARMMVIAEGAAGFNRPRDEVIYKKNGQPDLNKDKTPKTKAVGDWEKFGAWFDRTVYCARELAKYQSATYRAIVVAAPTATTPAAAAPAQIEDGDSSRRAERAYLRLIKGN